MRLLALATEVLRGAALAVVGGFLFAFVILSLAQSRAASVPFPESLLHAALVAGTVVYLARWIVLCAGALLGWAVFSWAVNASNRGWAFARGALLGSSVGAVVTLAVSYITGGPGVTEEITRMSVPVMFFAAGLFVAVCVGSYSLLRWVDEGTPHESMHSAA